MGLLRKFLTALLFVWLAAAAVQPACAGGSNNGVPPGSRDITGKVTEWPVPTPKFARDPAIGPDGNIYISVMNGNRIARFDVAAKSFKEWDLPRGARPHGLVVAADGKVFFTGMGNGTLGEFDPATGKTIAHATSSTGSGPHTVVIAGDGAIWFTMQASDRIGRYDRTTGKLSEYSAKDGPYGIAIDKSGAVWICEFGGSTIAKLDPASGRLTELSLGADSHPRRMAVAPDGMLWVTLFGKNTLARVDPAAMKLVKEYPLPAGPSGGAYAVTVDGAGRVWANEIQTDTVIGLDPKTEAVRVIALPSKNVGIRKMIVDDKGRIWYMGSHNGRLGMIE